MPLPLFRHATPSWPQTATAYQRYIQDVLLRLGATTDRAGRLARNLFHYEKRLVEAWLEPLELRDPARPLRRVTVDWLRKESPQVGPRPGRR